jgi:hypothetical protein
VSTEVTTIARDLLIKQPKTGLTNRRHMAYE